MRYDNVKKCDSCLEVYDNEDLDEDGVCPDCIADMELQDEIAAEEQHEADKAGE